MESRELSYKEVSKDQQPEAGLSQPSPLPFSAELVNLLGSLCKAS
jgi:hypothetical protein